MRGRRPTALAALTHSCGEGAHEGLRGGPIDARLGDTEAANRGRRTAGRGRAGKQVRVEGQTARDWASGRDGGANGGHHSLLLTVGPSAALGDDGGRRGGARAENCVDTLFGAIAFATVEADDEI